MNLDRGLGSPHGDDGDPGRHGRAAQECRTSAYIDHHSLSIYRLDVRYMILHASMAMGSTANLRISATSKPRDISAFFSSLWPFLY